VKIIHFADLHLGVESYGRIDPDTGLSSRLTDFLAALDQLVDYAIASKVDLVIFCGDAYKTREPTQTQQREFAKRINRLSTSSIPVLLLIGNHDLPNAIGRATATEIFDTLAVKHVYVANRPHIHRIPTASGPVQVATLPWLRRHSLLNKENTKNLTFEQINQKLEQALTQVVTDHARHINPELPAILAAHVWVSGARIGSERSMSIGQDPTLLLGNIANPAFDYVALGHIHRHQILQDNPPVVYAGSLQAIDFGEEEDDKGFYTVAIEADTKDGTRRVTVDFHPIPGRRLLTINATITPQDIDPTLTVINAVSRHREQVAEAIVRLHIELPAEAEALLRENEIRHAARDAYYLAITKEISHPTRLRLGNRIAEEITPVDALKTYLTSRMDITPARAQLLLRYGEELINKQTSGHK